MPVPDYQALMLPLLSCLADGATHELREVREQIASNLRLTDDDRAERLPSGKQAVYDNRLGWAKTYLDKAGLLKTVKRGVYQITDSGRGLLAERPRAIDNELLSRFVGFQQFVLSSSSSGGDGDTQRALPTTQTRATPREVVEGALAEMRSSLKSEVLASVMRASPAFFERLVVDLLLKMGYGGPLGGSVTGRSGDGGIDGLIKQDRLGLDAIYVQAKRWQNTVGRPEVQAFAGSLDGERAKKGVFITTSTFSREAEQYVARIEKKIVLIDGDQLAGLMIDHEIGVTLVDTYQIKRLDTDYFSEE